ncbi:winged helix-turn-helix domain-containing protein [Streptomyces sp. ME01-24h]|nr:winged helix-turn-helix domain-containing protein [Streptomyces sp. ME01-24h]
MQAAELFEQGIKPLEVARRPRVSGKSAYQWHQLWRHDGEGALVSRGPSGSRCRLSPHCLENLVAYLEEGPAAHGWVADQVWTAARVATLIGRKFHVSYSVSGATRLMHRLGCRHGVAGGTSRGVDVGVRGGGGVGHDLEHRPHQFLPGQSAGLPEGEGGHGDRDLPESPCVQDRVRGARSGAHDAGQRAAVLR